MLRAGLTGWSNWLAQVTGAPSVDYAMSAMILAAASISHPDYVPQNYQIFLLTTLVMLIHGCISSMPTRWLAQFNSAGSTFNIVALCIVIILIPASVTREEQGLPKFTSASEVWGNFYEGTDFPKGVSLLMTFVAVIWTMRYGESAQRRVTDVDDFQWLRRPIPPQRRMLKCQHRSASSYCSYKRCRRVIWVVSAAGGCIHGHRYR